MAAGDVVENELKMALEQAGHAQGSGESAGQPAIVWLVGDGASWSYPVPWGKVMEFILRNSCSVLAEGVGANVSYAEMMKVFRESQRSGRRMTPVFRVPSKVGNAEEVVAAAAVSAIAADAGRRGCLVPPAEEILILDRAFIREGGTVFHAYVMAARGKEEFFADVIVPLERIADIGVQIKVFPELG
jgi:hypothetical protein